VHPVQPPAATSFPVTISSKHSFQVPQPRLNLRQRLYRIAQHLLIQQQIQRRIRGFLNEINTWIGFNGDLP
jgi:hypothetical protein